METLIEGATSFSNLPLAPENRSWDSGPARQRIAKWASSDGSGDKGKVDWSKYAKCFFWFDSADSENFGAYKLPFADIIDGTATAVWAGVHAAYGRLGGTQGPSDSDKAKIKSHIKRYYAKFKKDFHESVDAETETAILLEQLEESQDLEECESLRDGLAELQHGDDDMADILLQADEKIDTLKQVDRIELVESFESQPKIVDRLADGRLRVSAIVGQVDTVNKNKRLYPKEEMQKAIDRANRQAKRGSMVGCDGHGGMFESQNARDIAVKWDKFMLDGKDLWAEGVTVPTRVGEDVRACWEAGIALEWSKYGFGSPEDVNDKKDKFSHSIIHDYILDRVDVVLRGADNTKTVSLTVENTQQPPSTQDDAAGEGTEMPEEKTPIVPETPEPEPKADEKPTPQPVDVKAIVEQVIAATAERDAKATAEVAAAMTERVLAEHKLAEHKAKLIADTPEKCVPAMKRALATAKTIEEADEFYAEFLPQIEDYKNPKPEYTGIAVVTEERHSKQFVDEWTVGDDKKPRPKTSGEAYMQLLESVEDNGRHEWDNPRNVMRRILDSYMDQHPDYFHYVTRDAIADAATTTTALGTMRAAMLPILRQSFPQLIPWEIAVVWPLDRPTGDIYSVDYKKYASSDLDDSSAFDSTWANHTQEASKAQIDLQVTSRTVTAIERAVRFELTSAVIQDARALYNIDLQGEMIRMAGDELARETNFAFIFMMLAQQGAGNVAYAQTPPSGSLYTGQTWNDRLGAHINKVDQLISEATYIEPNWIIAGPAAASCLKSMKSCMLASESEVRKFGDGLSFVGMVDGTKRLYQCAWFTTNKMLIGYRPPSWSNASAVYCPYIPIETSPIDYRADTNVLHRSVSKRDAMTVLKATGLGTITTSTGTAASDVVYS